MTNMLCGSECKAIKKLYAYIRVHLKEIAEMDGLTVKDMEVVNVREEAVLDRLCIIYLFIHLFNYLF